MGIAHRHFDTLVTHKFLHRAEVNTSHDETAGERVHGGNAIRSFRTFAFGSAGLNQ